MQVDNEGGQSLTEDNESQSMLQSNENAAAPEGSRRTLTKSIISGALPLCYDTEVDFRTFKCVIVVDIRF